MMLLIGPFQTSRHQNDWFGNTLNIYRREPIDLRLFLCRSTSTRHFIHLLPYFLVIFNYFTRLF